MAERNIIKKVDSEKLAAGTYLATFTDGRVVEFDVKTLLPDPSIFEALPEMFRKFVMYGVKQKLDDSMADSGGNIDVAVEELKSTIEAIGKGSWSTRVAGEGEQGGLFHRALAAVQEISLADAKIKISALIERNKVKNPDASERALLNAIRQNMLAADPKLAAKYEELRKARESKPNNKLSIDLTA